MIFCMISSIIFFPPDECSSSRIGCFNCMTSEAATTCVAAPTAEKLPPGRVYAR